MGYSIRSLLHDEVTGGPKNHIDEKESPMCAHSIVTTVLALSTALALGAPAMAADVPGSGTIKVHGNLSGNPQVVQVGQNHFMGSWSGWGITYNDAGSGPFHLGALLCTYTFDDHDGSFTHSGGCEFSDAGGADKIFVLLAESGKGFDNEQGTGTITGGIGKYADIDGKAAYLCKAVDQTQHIVACALQLEYHMAMAATK